MSGYRVDVFFYGSYINFDVLAEVDIDARDFQVVSLPNYKLTIGPRANLEKSATSTSFGIVTQLTHAELDRLYSEHSQKILGEIYLPEAVLVKNESDTLIPVLTYICNDMTPAKPDAAYVKRILKPAKNLGFPEDYLKHIESYIQ